MNSPGEGGRVMSQAQQRRRTLGPSLREAVGGVPWPIPMVACKHATKEETRKDFLKSRAEERFAGNLGHQGQEST